MPPRLRQQIGATAFVGSFPDEVPVLGLPEVAFAGRSNVGKSSALNRLLGGRKAARVSSRPGRTQAINLFKVGSGCAFVDLPGYGYAAVPDEVAEAWKPMIEGYLGTREALALVVILVDARREPQETDAVLVDGLEDAGLPYLVIATKIDKLSKHQRKPVLARLAEALELPPGQPVGFSSKTGEGIDDVWSVIEQACAEHRP